MPRENFHIKLKECLRQSGYSQKQLAYQLGMHPAALSNKLNEHNYAVLSYPEAKQIIKILAEWSAIHTRKEVAELLVEIGIASSGFTKEEWNTFPLSLLEGDLPTERPIVGGQISLRAKHISNPTPPDLVARAPLRDEEWPGSLSAQTPLYGRATELVWLEEQICQRGAQLVGLTGFGGIGKTTLAFKFAQTVKTSFEYVIWYSLYNAPLPQTTLIHFLNFLLKAEQVLPPTEWRLQLAHLLECLQQTRCLLILDNFETVLATGKPSGTYLKGYEGYDQLLNLVGTQNHRSCVLLTSREKPRELSLLENHFNGKVVSLVVGGINAEAGQKLLVTESGISISGTSQEWQKLVNYYVGNPLALKLLVKPLQELFGGRLGDFLNEKWGVFADIQDLIKQQFERLSELEQAILYWLTVERQALSLEELKANFQQVISNKELAATLVSLGRRSLLESKEKAGYFGLQPVIMEYLTERLVTQVAGEIIQGKVATFLNSYTLLKAEAPDYIRESQRTLILLPVLNRLKIKLMGQEQVIQRLWELIAQIKAWPMEVQAYGAGNLINLLVGLKADLRGADFSQLRIWQAYLQRIPLEEVNLVGSDLRGTLFSNAFSSVNTVAFSPDGTRLASGGQDGAIRLWDVHTGQCQNVFEGHTNFVWSVAFSPDGKLLASGSADRTLRLWEMATGQCLVVLEGHSGEVISVAFSPDGSLLASCGYDYIIRLWDVNSWQCLQLLKGHTDEVSSVAFSPDGKVLASGSHDRTIRLWDLSKGQCSSILLGHSDQVQSVAFNQDGRTLASGGNDRTIRLWDLSNGKCSHIFQGHTAWIYSVTFSPDGKLLVSGGSDHTIRLWDLNNVRNHHMLQGHLNPIRNLAFSPEGKLLASGSEDQTIRLWNVEQNLCLRIYEGYSNQINSVAYSPDGNLFVVGSDDNAIRVWEVASRRLLKILQGHKSFVKSVAFSPDGKVLASGSADHTIRLWDLASGQCLKIVEGYSSWIFSLVFSPDGQYLANSSYDHNIYLGKLDSQEHPKVFQRDISWGGKVIAFSSDSQLLASGSIDPTIQLWDLSARQHLASFAGHTNEILAVDFSPDGKLLASGSADHTIRIWDLASKRCLKILQGHNNWVFLIGFSPDGHYLVSSGYDHRVQVWNTHTWQTLWDLKGHIGIVRTIAFKPDSPLMVGGDANYLRIWNLQTGELAQTIKNPGLYENMNISGVNGLSSVQIAGLTALGAVKILKLV